MPCDSSHMEATANETASANTCRCLDYALVSCGKAVPQWVTDGQGYYGSPRHHDEACSMLCSILRGADDEWIGRFVYDGRNPKARMLADWWERHQEVDRKREQEERNRAEVESRRMAAMAKLTKEERGALGLD